MVAPSGSGSRIGSSVADGQTTGASPASPTIAPASLIASAEPRSTPGSLRHHAVAVDVRDRGGVRVAALVAPADRGTRRVDVLQLLLQLARQGTFVGVPSCQMTAW